MGQAKQRGTLEQRVKQAQEQKDDFYGTERSVAELCKHTKQQARYAVGRCLMLWSSNDVTQQGSRPKTKLGLFDLGLRNLASEPKKQETSLFLPSALFQHFWY